MIASVKKIFVLLLLSLLTVEIFAQKEDLYLLMKERNEFYFCFEIDDYNRLGEFDGIISVDKVDDGKVLAYADNNGYECFLALGYETTLLTPPSMSEDYEMYDGRTRADYEWDKYPTYEAYVAMMEEFATTYPEKCSLIELGTLESGRKILLARINDGNPDGKPKLLYGSTIHGDETTGFVMMLRLVNQLLAYPDLPEVRNVLENIDLFICPNANPDGTYHYSNQTVKGATRSNAKGIDMNRNYPDAIEGAHPDDKEYAAETEWFMQLAEDYQFTMAAHFHGGAELVNYPWDNDYARHVDDDWWRMISRQYADLAHEKNTDYMTDEDNGVTNGADWYKIGGGRQDYMNHYHQCRELTVECSTVKCPSASKLPLYWEYNYNSIFAFMNQVLCGIHGTVRDAETKLPLEATLRILDHDEDYSVVESQMPFGDFYRPIKAGTYVFEIESDGYYPIQKTITVIDGESAEFDVELKPKNVFVAEKYMSLENYDVEIHPNPAEENICVSVNLDSECVTWNLVNMQGQIVKKSFENTSVFSIKLDDINGGIYFLNVAFDEKQIIKKIVVK